MRSAHSRLFEQLVGLNHRLQPVFRAAVASVGIGVMLFEQLLVTNAHGLFCGFVVKAERIERFGFKRLGLLGNGRIACERR